MATAHPPATPAEARERFYARYGWALVIALLGDRAPAVPPVTVDQWYTLAQATRAALQADPAEQLAGQLEQAARALRAQRNGDAP